MKPMDRPLDGKLPLLLALLFFASRLPVCFFPNHWEELRDFDVFLQVAEGHLPYRDVYWHYGPLTPLLYGGLLKLLPHVLLSVRALSLVICSGGVFYLARLLGLFCTRASEIALGTFLASSVLFYPNYSHNHWTVAVASIAFGYYVLAYSLDGSAKALWGAFGCALIALLVRPILTGYAITALGALVFAWTDGARPKRKQAALMLLVAALVFALLGALFGASLRHAFIPRAASVYPPRGYPNLHFLFPRPDLGEGLVVGLLKAGRTSVDTFFFYLQFFILPSVLMTRLRVGEPSRKIVAALICLAIAICGAVDVLHYGDVDPSSDPIMLGRGHYFAAMTLVCVFLLMLRRKVAETAAATVLFAALALWGYLPYASGAYAWSRAKVNPFGFPALTGIATLDGLLPLYSAIERVNSQCLPGESVFIAFYGGGVGRLVHCADLLEKDNALMDGYESAILAPGESPYNPRAAVRVGDLLDERLREGSPRFLLGPADSRFLKACSSAPWQTKDFGPNGTLRLCWKPSPASS